MSYATNPYFVLEVPHSATNVEIERAGQKLLAMLGVGLAAAGTYPTPIGEMPRDEDLVRVSLDALRDPAKRLAAQLTSGPVVLRESSSQPSPTRAWPEAPQALGWEP